jgi:hypothetical protein
MPRYVESLTKAVAIHMLARVRVRVIYLTAHGSEEALEIIGLQWLFRGPL